MRSSRNVLSLFAGALAALSAACGGGSVAAPDAGCVALFSGNFDDTVSSGACPTLGSAPDGGAGSALDFTLNSAVAGAPTQIELDLGAPYTSGTFTAESVASWSATGINTIDCEFSAGSAAVPTGSFTLTLTSPANAKEPALFVPHGTLSVTQYVKAPPDTDCGPADTEQIDVTF